VRCSSAASPFAAPNTSSVGAQTPRTTSGRTWPASAGPSRPDSRWVSGCRCRSPARPPAEPHPP
jgi:hypothetical protein